MTKTFNKWSKAENRRMVGRFPCALCGAGFYPSNGKQMYCPPHQGRSESWRDAFLARKEASAGSV